PVLVVQVVGVFPDVQAEHGSLTLHDWIVLVREIDHLKTSAVRDDQPGPATAESARTGSSELLTEARKIAERRANRFSEISTGLATGIRSHDLPEERMVGVSATVVPDGGAHVLRHPVEVLQQVLDATALQLRMLSD